MEFSRTQRITRVHPRWKEPTGSHGSAALQYAVSQSADGVGGPGWPNRGRLCFGGAVIDSRGGCLGVTRFGVPPQRRPGPRTRDSSRIGWRYVIAIFGSIRYSEPRGIADHQRHAGSSAGRNRPVNDRLGVQVLSVNAGGTALTYATPAGGGSGTVTSVSWTGDGVIFSASADTPVTTSGTLLPTGLVAQTANRVFAGPASAGPTAPSFRALATADIPALPASQITSGQLAVAQGGTALTAMGTASQVLGVNVGANALEYKTITAGANVTVTPTAGTITIAASGSGGGDTTATYITQTADATLTNSQHLSSLTTGLVKVTTGTGVLTTAAAGTDYLAPSGSGAALTGITESQVTNLTTDLAAKAPLASPTFTGTVTLPVGLTGLAKLASGVVSTATAGTDYLAPSGSGAARHRDHGGSDHREHHGFVWRSDRKHR